MVQITHFPFLPRMATKLKANRKVVAEAAILQDSVVSVECVQTDLADLGGAPAGVAASDCPPALKNEKLQTKTILIFILINFEALKNFEYHGSKRFIKMCCMSSSRVCKISGTKSSRICLSFQPKAYSFKNCKITFQLFNIEKNFYFKRLNMTSSIT